MENNDPKIIEKIKAILARSVKGPFETDEAFNNRLGEVANALIQARRMMEKYGVSLLEVHSHDTEFTDTLAGMTHIDVMPGQGVAFSERPHTSLANYVAKACFCKTLWDPYRKMHMFIGERVYVEVCAYMYSYIFDQLYARCKILRSAEHFKGGSNEYKKFTTDFLFGGAHRVSERMEKEFSMDGEAQVALVLWSNKRNDAYIDKTFGNVKSIKARPINHSQAYRDGYYEGGKISVSRPTK